MRPARSVMGEVRPGARPPWSAGQKDAWRVVVGVAATTLPMSPLTVGNVRLFEPTHAPDPHPRTKGGLQQPHSVRSDLTSAPTLQRTLPYPPGPPGGTGPDPCSPPEWAVPPSSFPADRDRLPERGRLCRGERCPGQRGGGELVLV